LDATAPERPRPSRRTLALILGPIIAVVIIGTLGNMFHPRLLRDHPLLLVAMEPRNRYLLLVAEKVDFVPYLVVATVRRLFSDPLFYLVGYLYGDSGVRWIERRLGDDVGIVRAMERGFRKAAPVMVFLFPGAIVCVLAGATGMSPVLFLAANVVGTVTVVTLLYRFAEFFDGPLGAVNRFYANNTKLLTVISIAATLFWLWDQRRRGKSELKSISTMEKELEEAAREGDGTGRPAEADDRSSAKDEGG
jgi:membrane protein DedA with SNARE-associated domain